MSRSFPRSRYVRLSAVALLFAAAASPLTATPARSPISLTMKVEGLEGGGRSGQILLEVSSLLDAPGTTLTLELPAGVEAEKNAWSFDLRAGESRQVATGWSWIGGDDAGNLVFSAKATRTLGPRSSWGDKVSVPLHRRVSGLTSSGWLVDQIPVARTVKPGTAALISTDPIPFAFDDLSAETWSEGGWPSTEALPPGAPPPGAPAAAVGAPVAAGTVTLTGTWKYPDRGGVPRAVDQQYLEIRKGDTTPLSPRVFCFTQADGDFSCSFPHPGTTLRVFLRSATNLTPGPTRLGVFSGIQIPGGCGSDSIDCTYVNTSPEIACADGTTCSLGILVAAGGEPWIGAHQMTQDLIRSWKKILFDTKQPAGSHGGPGRISYPTPTGHGPHAHVFNSGSETTGDPWICIPAPFQTASDVVAHEYGHAVMDNLWHGFSPGWSTDDCPSSHAFGYPSGPGCALSEGFADFWSWYSNEFYDGDADTSNDGPIYDDPGFSVDMETRDGGTWYGGGSVEGNVAGVFGDMLDLQNEGPPPCGGSADRMADGIQYVWETLHATSYADIAAWFNAWWSVWLHPRTDGLEMLHHNGIDYGFPANGTCASAEEIVATTMSDQTDTAVTLCPDPGAPVPVCGNGSSGKAAYYHWTAPGAGTVTVDTFGSGYDTILSAWTGPCGSLVSRGCDDDTSGTQSRLSFSVAKGESLTFMASAYYSDGGDLSFQFDYQPAPAGNDTCAGAKSVPSVPYVDAVDIAAAGNDASDPAHACALGGTTHSVFYRWTAPATGTVRADTLGSDYDTILSAYTGTCGAFSPVACDDDTAAGNAVIEFTVSVGTTLTFMISHAVPTPPSSSLLFFHLDFTAPPPANDTCTTATIVPAFPYTNLTTTGGAGSSPGDPIPSCGNQSAGRNVWYRFTAPASGVLTVDTWGSSYDTILAAYTGGCGVLSEILGACSDDDQPPATTSRIQFVATAGTTYHFQVSAYNNDGGSLAFHLDLAASPPANDQCGGTSLIAAGPYNDLVYTGSATTSAGDPFPPCGSQSAARNVWYRFTAPVSGTIQLDTSGSDYDTILAAWQGGCAALAAVACNEDAGATPQSALALAAIKGRTYHFSVGASGGAGGNLSLSFDFLPDAGHVPDGYFYPGQAVGAELLPGDWLRLEWGASCLETDTDYAIYEGQLGAWYSHAPMQCGTGGALNATFRPAPHDTYYLVVPRNGIQEGSHGLTGAGLERPAGTGTCLPPAVGACTPSCGHDLCATGAAIDPACSACAATICAGAPECCASGWNTDCAAEAVRSCPAECI